MMRTIFVIGILLLCAFVAGWFTVQRDEEGTTIRINRDEIRQDARQAIQKGVSTLARTVRSTLGPRGRNVIPRSEGGLAGVGVTDSPR